MNAVVAAAGQLPSCQVTGTAIVMGKKGGLVLTDGDDAEAISRGIFDTYRGRNLRYSQLAPVEMFKEKNTASNLPRRSICTPWKATPTTSCSSPRRREREQKLPIPADAGGAEREGFDAFVRAQAQRSGHQRLPAYHLAIVVGGPAPRPT
jgi:fumarate hydratase class I